MITKHRPWKHQQEAFDFVRRLENGGALLAMAPGTGKSKVTIDLLQNERVPSMRILIACPKSVIDVWPMEFTKHAVNPDKFPILAIRGSSVGRRTAAMEAFESTVQCGQTAVFVVNYEACWREPMRTFLLDREWDWVVTDESHRIKAAGSKVSRFFAMLRDQSFFRLALSGTPMPHSPLDLYGQYRFLD